MKLSVISFTRKGMMLSRHAETCLEERSEIDSVEIFTKWNGEPENGIYYVSTRIGEWAGAQMREHAALLFIGACGIAVRAIAPYVTDKLCDSPVLVMDELGRYVIPILSGHMGGANELAVLLSSVFHAEPVITTATDINGRFAVDLFAKKNHLIIKNREGIARISAKILDGKEISVSVETGHLDHTALPDYLSLKSYPPTGFTDIVITSESEPFDAGMILKPKLYGLGMGCRKGKDSAELCTWIQKVLAEYEIEEQEIFALASIDRKADEPCFLNWSREKRVPFYTFSAEELESVSGMFHGSAFVKAQVGVENVCERAALIVCGKKGKLLVPKRAEQGMTIAIAKRDWSVRFDET
ncbi:MAG: cobalt-precorrin 5A hydrolase [Brotaphodocola sp.]